MPVSRLTTFAAGAALATATLLTVPMNSVGSPQIKNNSITNKDVKDGTLKGVDLADDTITSDEIIDGGVKANDLGQNVLPTPEQWANTTVYFTGCDPAPCMLTTLGDYYAAFDGDLAPGSSSSTVGQDDVTEAGTVQYQATASFGTFASGSGVTCQLMDGMFSLSGQEYLKLPAGSRGQIVIAGMGALPYESGAHDVKLYCWSDNASAISVHNASITLTVGF